MKKLMVFPGEENGVKLFVVKQRRDKKGSEREKQGWQNPWQTNVYSNQQ